MYSLETSAMYNPFFLLRNLLRVGEVKTVNFFKVTENGGEIVASCRWFSILRQKNGKRLVNISTNNDFKLVHLPYTEIPYRKKESFGKDKAFYMKVNDKYSGTLLVLYLDIDSLKDFTIETSKPELMYNGAVSHTYKVATFAVQGASRRTEWDGTDDCDRTAVFTFGHEEVKTEFGQMCEEIADKMGKETRYYDVSNLIASGAMDEIIKIYNNYYSKVSKEISNGTRDEKQKV